MSKSDSQKYQNNINNKKVEENEIKIDKKSIKLILYNNKNKKKKKKKKK